MEMRSQPVKISPEQIPEVIAREFKRKGEITCYVGSNAATPTASIEALTAAVKNGRQRLPF
jgi:hypothetical protein